MSALPIIVTDSLSKTYYKGLPSKPPLIATTKPGPFDDPSGPEAYSVMKELRCLGDHQLATVWDNGLAIQLRHYLTTLGVNWTSLEALRIVNVDELSGPPIVWIGVEPGTLNFEEGSRVAVGCHTLIHSHGICDYYVEIRESRIVRLAGNRLIDPVPPSNPTFTACDPYTATLGIPISPKDRPWSEGTGGFYLSAGGNDTSIYLVTARHVVLPSSKDDNKEYSRQNTSKAPEEVVVLGTCAFASKLEVIQDEINGQECGIIDAKERMHWYSGRDDPDSVREHAQAEKDWVAAEHGLAKLKTLHQEVSRDWSDKERRVIGELTWAPPIILSTEPGQYTLDLAIIKIAGGTLDNANYCGNTINLGNKYSRHEFMKKVYLHHTSPSSFKFPASRLVKLEDQVPESALFKPPMKDANGFPCLVVFKNGAGSGTTVGRANNVSSYTRNYFAGEYHESREWPIVSTNMESEVFSTKGDSGSCVADAYRRVGGIITGGSGATDSSDVTYVTPISFIMKVLHATGRFKNAYLNPTLTPKETVR